MRKIIEREVISNYKIRFRDINIPLIAYSRDKNNIAPLTGIKKKKDRGFTYWEINIDIETFIKQLSDKELFTALDAQLGITMERVGGGWGWLRKTMSVAA